MSPRVWTAASRGPVASTGAGPALLPRRTAAARIDMSGESFSAQISGATTSAPPASSCGSGCLGAVHGAGLGFHVAVPERDLPVGEVRAHAVVIDLGLQVDLGQLFLLHAHDAVLGLVCATVDDVEAGVARQLDAVADLGIAEAESQRTGTDDAGGDDGAADRQPLPEALLRGRRHARSIGVAGLPAVGVGAGTGLGHVCSWKLAETGAVA